MLPAPLVLIADDDRLSRQLLRTFLENAGYRVIEAEDGARALAMAQEHQPSVALLDVQMRGQTGYDVCRQLKADPATQPIKVAIITAYNASADHEAARAAGADEFLYKLLGWPEIMTRLVRLTEASSMPA